MKARLEIAANAHSGLKAAAAAATSITASGAVSTRNASGEEDGGEEAGSSTMQSAAFVVGAIYDRLEEARQAALAASRGGGEGVELGAASTVVSVAA